MDKRAQNQVQSTQKPSEVRPTVPLLLALVITATALPFLPALRYGFVYHDDVQVVQNIAARSSQSATTYFFRSIWNPRNLTLNYQHYPYYRPLLHFWLRLNAALFGYHVVGWHLAAVTTHLVVTVLVFFLIRHYLQDPRSAMVGALIFGVHPVHIESVVWISGVADPLMTLGVLGSFLLWLKKLETAKGRLLIGSLTCYAGALLSKETAIVLPIIVFGSVLFGMCPIQNTPQSVGRRVLTAMRETLPFAAIAVIYFGLRLAVFQSFRVAWRPWLSASQALLTVPSLLVFYLQQLVWPVALRLFYDFRLVSSPREMRFWAPLVVFLATTSGVLFWSRRNGDRRIPVAALWLAIPLVPVLNVGFFSRDDFVHDRYLYLPSIGLAILCSVAAKGILGGTPSRRRRLLTLASITMVITSLAVLTATESLPWQDNLSLYSRAAQNSTNTMARINLASEYAILGQLEEAKQLLEPVVQERPDFWLANYNLGYVDYRLRDYDTAEQLLDRAIALNPTEADAYVYRGLICLRRNRLEDASKLLRDAIALNPLGEGYHFALGMVLTLQNPEAAKSEFRNELKYHPTNGLAKMQLDLLEKSSANRNSPAVPAPETTLK